MPVNGANQQYRTQEEINALYPGRARNLVCPKCKGKLVLKDSFRRVVFYGCENWQRLRCPGFNANQVTGLPTNYPGLKAPKEVKTVDLSPVENARRTLAALVEELRTSGKITTSPYAWLNERLGRNPKKKFNLSSLDLESCAKCSFLIENFIRPKGRYALLEENLC